MDIHLSYFWFDCYCVYLIFLRSYVKPFSHRSKSLKPNWNSSVCRFSWYSIKEFADTRSVKTFIFNLNFYFYCGYHPFGYLLERTLEYLMQYSKKPVVHISFQYSKLVWLYYKWIFFRLMRKCYTNWNFDRHICSCFLHTKYPLILNSHLNRVV